jgi:S-adenosylmethionine hydrolase
LYDKNKKKSQVGEFDMRIVTLTTDMGRKDHYLGSVKGALVRHVPDVQMVDISHEIPAFDITQTAFILKNVFHEFPEGTIHLIGVNAERIEKEVFSNQPGVAHLVVTYKNHYFIGADNGIFSLLFDEKPQQIIEINLPIEAGTFPLLHIFVPAAAHILKNKTPDGLGEKLDSFRESMQFVPVVESNLIRGMIIYIDSYGNAITNISIDLFKQIGKERDFTIMLPRSKYNINQLSRNYADVPEGEPLALFSSSGNLQIAINKGVESMGGGANKLLGLKLNDIIQVEFE